MNDDYGRKYYFYEKNISEVREFYRTRVSMQPFAENYANDKRFAATNWLCRCNIERETEAHLTSGTCPVFGDLVRKDFDFTKDKDLVLFFSQVLERRDTIDLNNKT